MVRKTVFLFMRALIIGVLLNIGIQLAAGPVDSSPDQTRNYPLTHTTNPDANFSK